MPDMSAILKGGNAVQKLIFACALYITAPAETPTAYIDHIMDDINRLEPQLTKEDNLVVKRAIKILVDVEGFPFVEEQTVADFLDQYKTEDSTY